VIQFAKHTQKFFGLVVFQFPIFHDGEPLFGKLCRQRRTQRPQQHFLGQRVTVIPRPWSVNRSAMAPEWRADGAHARAPSALLLPQLAARATDFTLVLGLVRTSAQPAQIPARSLMQKVLIHLDAK